MIDVVPPLLHEYEVAVPAVKLTVCPLQTVVGLALTVTLGYAYTVTACAAVDVHPLILDPITV